MGYNMGCRGQLTSQSSACLAGRSCIRGNITAATLQDNLFLVHYDCAQLESCLGSHVLRVNLDPLLQHPLPSECQRVVKAKLTQVCGRQGRRVWQGMEQPLTPPLAPDLPTWCP